MHNDGEEAVPERSRVVFGRTPAAQKPTPSQLLSRQTSEALRAHQRFANRHTAILQDPSAPRQGGLLELLAAYTSLAELLDNHRDDLVVLARHQGVTWPQIAVMLGITRQAAQQRYTAAVERAARHGSL